MRRYEGRNFHFSQKNTEALTIGLPMLLVNLL